MKEDADEDATKFSQDVMTDSNGKLYLDLHIY